MLGGGGNDTYVVENSGDKVEENSGAGTDTVQSLLTYTLPSNVENLQLMGTGSLSGTGNELSNVISGTTGNNLLDGGSGAGIDTLSYQYGVKSGVGVTVSLALTTAQSTGGSGSDTVKNFENLTGSIYNDKLTGDANNNALTGSTGVDTLRGNGGNDTFVYTAATDSGVGTGNRDIISDFVSGIGTSGDRISVKLFDSNLSVAGIQPWTYVTSSTTSGGQMHFNAATHVLSFDQIIDSSHHAVVSEIQLTGISALQSTDFILV